MSTSTIPTIPTVEGLRRRTLAPATRARLTTLAALAVAVVGPLTAAAALVPARGDIDSANVALVLVVVVVGVAATARRGAAAVAAISATVWFDFFFTQPFNRFTVDSGNDVETMLLLLVVGIAVGQVAVVGRRHVAVAARRAADVARIRRVSRLVAQRSTMFEVVGVVQAELVDLLHLRSCSVESGRDPTRRPHITPAGELVHGQVRWGTATLGLPSPEVELSAGTMRFVLVPTPGELVPADRLQVALVLADLAGAAVTAGTR